MTGGAPRPSSQREELDLWMSVGELPVRQAFERKKDGSGPRFEYDKYDMPEGAIVRELVGREQKVTAFFGALHAEASKDSFTRRRLVCLQGPSHGDLHDGNILADEDGRVFVIDFDEHSLKPAPVLTDWAKLFVAVLFLNDTEPSDAETAMIEDLVKLIATKHGRPSPW